MVSCEYVTVTIKYTDNSAVVESEGTVENALTKAIFDLCNLKYIILWHFGTRNLV